MNSLNNYLLIKTASVLITGVNINEKKNASWSLHSSGGGRQ